MPKRRNSYEQMIGEIDRTLSDLDRGKLRISGERTVGGSVHRRATPRIVGASNVANARQLLGMCPVAGCLGEAGHSGPHRF